MDAISGAAERLRQGGLVAFPTETVYGLGGDATSPDAVARIFAAKGRPRFNPLIAHVADLEAAHAQGRFDADAERLAAAFWPGPLTLVVPRSPRGTVCDLACAGLHTLGLRVPAHPMALALLRAFGGPVAAPSANRSGRLSPTSADDVVGDLGAVLEAERDAILDGGDCEVGLESSIVACLDDGSPALLRPGGIARDDLERVLGRELRAPGSGIEAPGMLASHYAPRASLRLDADAIGPGEVGLGFAGHPANCTLDLSPTGDLVEAASNLYRYLRRLDSLATGGIAVTRVPTRGLGVAIADRLRRAAAPRDLPQRDQIDRDG